MRLEYYTFQKYFSSDLVVRILSCFFFISLFVCLDEWYILFILQNFFADYGSLIYANKQLLLVLLL